ncbi:MAG TPA: SEC-C domain-containing protein, partial [Jiangellaceae bacterium]|nr:SEC-C domain-containing protein [Jiangellaceae bacterium]
MMDAIKEESVGLLFNLEVQVKPKAEGEQPTDEAAGPAVAQAAHAAPVLTAKGLAQEQRPAQLQYSAPTVDGDATVQRRTERSGGARTAVASGAGGARGTHAATGDDGEIDFSNVARNALCPCGSGKKFKRCHGDPKSRVNRVTEV